MKHFLESDGKTIRAFEDDGSQDYLITDDMRLLSELELAELRNPSPEALWFVYQQAAKSRLNSNDLVAFRCFKAGVIYPKEWLAYDEKLRDIVSASSGDPTKPLPMQPATYPPGS